MTAAQKRKKLKVLKAELAKLTPHTPDYDAVRYAIVNLQDDPTTSPVVQGATPGAPNATGGTSKPPTAKATTVSFSYDEMVKKTGFAPTERNVKAMDKRKATVPSPSFISGGTPAQKAALAKKIANMTITSGMSAADAAKIRKARLWYTGQTGGRTGKGKAGDAKYTSGSVKDQLVNGKKAGKPRSKTKTPKGETAHVTLRGQTQARGGTTADVARQTAANAKVAPKSKTKAQKPYVPGQINKSTSGSGKRYGGVFGPNPESTTAGRGATTVPPAKKDRYRGRKSRSQTKTTALPGAGGSLEFATAAVAREKRVAARRKTEAENRATESRRERIATAKEAGTRLGKGRRKSRPVVNPIPDSVGSYLSNFITSGQTPTGKGGGQASASSQQRAASRKKAKTAEELRSVGYNPKPKKPKKSSPGGGR